MTIESIAYHEAGHASVAHTLRAELNYLVLERKRRLSEDVAWGGRVFVDYGSLSKQACRRIAFAGFFVSTKRLAMTKLISDVTVGFDAHAVADFARQILEYDPSANKSEIVGQVGVGCSALCELIQINPDDIECDVAELLHRDVPLERDSIQADLEWAQCWAHDPANWQSVEAVARSILQRRPEEVEEGDVLLRIRIEGDEITQLIENARS